MARTGPLFLETLSSLFKIFFFILYLQCNSLPFMELYGHSPGAKMTPLHSYRVGQRVSGPERMTL